MDGIQRRAVERTVEMLSGQVESLLRGSEDYQEATTKVLAARLAIGRGDYTQARQELSWVRFYINSRD